MNSRIVVSFKKNALLVAIVFLTALMGFYRPSFLSGQNISNILIEFAPYGVVTLAMTLAIICGEFDLSPTAVFAWSSILFIDMVNKVGPLPALLITLISGLVFGGINGFFVAKMKMSAFVVTLATMALLRGLALTYTDAQPVNTSNASVLAFGNAMIGPISILTVVFVVVLVVLAWVMRNTAFGRNIYATGGDYEVAKTAGVSVVFSKFIVFVILGVLGALGGIMVASRVGSGSILFGPDLSMSTVAATVIGGTSLAGGSGSVWRTLTGLLFLALMFNALTILGMQSNLQTLVKGLVLVFVVMIDLATQNALKNRKVIA